MILDLLREQSPFITCFHIKLSDGNILRLSSSSKRILIENIVYFPYSGLVLDSHEMNDSAHNYIKIKGIFEKHGIEKGLNLENSEIGIYFYFYNYKRLLEYITYPYNSISHDGTSFTILLKSEIYRLHKSILQNYSTSCRAIFGDSKCKINKELYSQTCRIIAVNQDVITVDVLNKPQGFFSGGTAMLSNGKLYQIKSNENANIILKEGRNYDVNVDSDVVVTPGCDKKFITCCNKYDNAVNFRGEPFIPWR